MYDMPELQRARGQVEPDLSRTRIFFSMSYIVKDNAFRKAANTWKNAVKRQEKFQATDHFLEYEIGYESGFKSAWAEIGQIAKRLNAVVWVGHLLTHASKGSSEDGLEFKKDLRDDGTLSRREIVSLPKLPWASDGYLLLAGCNTGIDGTRSWSPGRVFADHQGVLTAGQNGYGYFSTKWNEYSVTTELNQHISLWAYRRGRNGYLGSGSRIPATIYKPSIEVVPGISQGAGTAMG